MCVESGLSSHLFQVNLCTIQRTQQFQLIPGSCIFDAIETTSTQTMSTLNKQYRILQYKVTDNAFETIRYRLHEPYVVAS